MLKNKRWKQKQEKKASTAPEVTSTPDSSPSKMLDLVSRDTNSIEPERFDDDRVKVTSNPVNEKQENECSESSALDEPVKLNNTSKTVHFEQAKIESLRAECDDLRAQLAEKNRLLSGKHAELVSSHTALESKTTELLTVQSHVYEIETHIQVSSKELQELTLSGVVDESANGWDNSQRMKTLISLLSTLKAQIKSQSDEISQSNAAIDTLHGNVRVLKNQILLLEGENKKMSETANQAMAAKDTQLEDSNREIEHLHNGLKSLQSQFVQLEKENKRTRQHLLELSESSSESVVDAHSRISDLSEEVSRLQGVVDQLENDKEDLMNEQKVSLEGYLKDLEQFRQELSDTIAELNASYTQLANMEAAHQSDIASLRDEMTSAAAAALSREQILTKESERWRRECELGREEQQEARHTIEELERYIAATGGEKEKLQVDLTEHLHQSDVKCSALTHQCEDLQEQLRQQGDENGVLKAELDRVMLSLKDSREELRAAQRALAEGTDRHETASSSYQAEIDRLTGELTVLDAIQAALRSDNDQLNQRLDQMQTEAESSHALSGGEYEKQIAELQLTLQTTEASCTAKVAELTASLQKASDALASHLNEESHVIRNAEKLIATLEDSLDSREKEASALSEQNKALELKVAELLSRAAAEAHNGVLSAERNNAAIGELAELRKEVTELKQRNAELQSSNNRHLDQLVDLQRHTMDTESRLSSELINLNSQIVELNRTVLELQAQLVDQQQRHTAQNHRNTARDAEVHVVFSKESVRAHLQRNGVKCFHWEDLPTLMKKLEQLHQQPDRPICYVSDVLDKVHHHSTGSGGHPPLTQQHLHQLNTSTRSAGSAEGHHMTGSVVPTTPTAAASAAAGGTNSRSSSAKKGRRPSSSSGLLQQEDATGQVYEVGYRFSNHSPPRVRRPSFNSETASRTSHTHSQQSHSAGGAAASGDKKFWHATGILDRDDPFGDHKLMYRDVREVHKSIEERFEFFRNQPMAFFEYHDKHTDSGGDTTVPVTAASVVSASVVESSVEVVAPTAETTNNDSDNVTSV